MRLLLLCAVLVVGLLTACDGATTGGSPPLPDEVTIREVHTSYTWYGWGSRGYTLDIECEGEDCTAVGTCSTNLGSGDGSEEIVTYDPVTIPAAAVNTLRVITTPSQPVDEPQEVIEHTDDYPNSQITLVTSEGETLLVTSTSNTEDGIPWNLQRNGAWYVHNNSAFPSAYAALLQSVKPTECCGF
jgi:hypothetical protein